MSAQRNNNDGKSITSYNSAQTDENLENIEKIKTLKNKVKILKNAARSYRQQLLDKDNEIASQQQKYYEMELKVHDWKKVDSKQTDINLNVPYTTGSTRILEESNDKRIKEIESKMEKDKKIIDELTEKLTQSDQNNKNAKEYIDKQKLDQEKLLKEMRSFSEDNIYLQKQIETLEKSTRTLRKELKHKEEGMELIQHDFQICETKNEDLQRTLNAKESRLTYQEKEMNILKEKTIDSEFRAYSFEVTRKYFGEKRFQLMMRRNVHHIFVVELENSLGYREVIPANIIQEVRHDVDSSNGVIISLRGAGFIGSGVDEYFETKNRTILLKNLRNFLKLANEVSLQLKTNLASSHIEFKKNPLEQIKTLFLG